MRRSSGDTQRVRNRFCCGAAGGASATRVAPSGMVNRSVLLVAVADAVEGLDMVERIVHSAELLADALDVTVYRPVIDIDVLAVSCVDELVPALYHTGPRRERLHQEKFRDRELDILAVPGALVFGLVQRQLAAYHDPTGCRA